MRSWPKSPALHFLVIGGLLFAASSFLVGRERRDSEEIVISAAEIQRLRLGWAERAGRSPEEADDRALTEYAVEEEILFREALARGIDRRDDVVWRRLVELGEFVADDAERDEPALVAEARRLGFDRRDVIIRRRLIELMRLDARRAEAPERVTDAELREAILREPDRYGIPPRVSLTHVYVSLSRRGEAAASDARRLLETLRTTGATPERAAALSDPFPTSFHVRRASESDLRRTFGRDFAAAVARANTGEWTGPFSSSYGEHLVWVHERFAAEIPALAAVRTQVLERLREERAEERLRNALRELRSRYAVRIAGLSSRAGKHDG